MIGALVVSWASPDAATAAARTLQCARELFVTEIGTIVCDAALSPVEHLLVAAAPSSSPDHHRDAASGRMAIVCSTTADTVDGPPISAGLLACKGDARLVDVVPPFSACWRTGHGQPVRAATDRCGLAPLYAWQGAGLAAICTSSVLLATATQIDVDERSIGAFALLGHHVGGQTWYPDIRKLQGSERAAVRCGRLTVTAPATQSAERHDPVGLSNGRTALQRAVTTALERHPDAAIELSGGMDCRAVLAAVPPAQRAGMTAITLGTPNSRDVTVAMRLAQRCGLRHEVIDITPLAQIDPTETLALVTTAGRRRDFGRDAVGAAVLDWVEQQTGQQARLTGQGGEFLRGHYYAGQPTREAPSPELLGRLARWRLFTVAAAEPALFAPTFLETARSDTTQRLWGELGGFDGDWLAATDELYLRVRMQRWAGSEYAPAALCRPVLAPYFHPGLLTWGRRMSGAEKRGGKALNALTVALDPTLGDIVLDTGLRPRDLAEPGWTTQAMLAAAAVRKLTRKMYRRLGGTTSATVGAADVARLVAAAWVTSSPSLERVAALPCMDPVAVMDVAAGRRRVGPAAIAFLVALDGVLAGAAR